MNIYKHIYKYVALLVALVITAGCSDEISRPDGEETPGLPAVISVALSSSDFQVVSRGDLTEGLDKQIASLWIGVYSVSGERTGSLFITDTEEFDGFHENKSVEIEAKSGPSYIVAVANYRMRPGCMTDGGAHNLNIRDALEDADTFDKYKQISAAFASSGDVSIDAALNPLLKSGHYSEDSSHGATDGTMPEMTKVNIRSGVSTLPGRIHLRSVISQVKFNVTFNTDTIESFSVSSWQVMNLPASAWLAEREPEDDPVNSTDVRPVGGSAFRNSQLMTDVHTTAGGCSFDFWMLENLRNGKDPDSDFTDSNAYSWREKEHKNADGTNSGYYRLLVDSPAGNDSLNNRATFVVMNVTMKMKYDEEGNALNGTSRTVNASYVIHLGYCEGRSNTEKALDFNCRRNSRYTYNVTVNNISGIKVEAERDEEKSPGAEGIITDITDDFWQLDAHYQTVNVYFSAAELRNFSYYIVAYDLNGNQVVIDSKNASTVPASENDSRYPYFSWIEFRQTNSETNLAPYKPASDAGTYLLTEMNSSRSAGWYTMFINEYVYEDKSLNGNEAGSRNWHGYVNRPDRRVWLNVEGGVSADGESVYNKSKYAVSQHSIQTYYAPGVDRALGVEHINETLGLNIRNNYRYRGNGDKDSGRHNLAEYIISPNDPPTSFSWTDDNANWSTFITLTNGYNTMQHINQVSNQNITIAGHYENLPSIVTNPSRTISRSTTYDYDKDALYTGNLDNAASGLSFRTYDPDRTSSSPRAIELMRACLNRNRDLDGDGKISANEVRWFLPTATQYVRIILGRRSLTTPLLNVDAITALPYSYSNLNSSLMYGTSDGFQMFTFEGTNYGNWRNWASRAVTPWEVRCIRNLGTDLNVISQNTTQPAFYIREGTNIVDLSRYDSRSLRSEPYRFKAYPMPVHHLHDQNYNRCYKAFEFAEDLIYISDVINSTSTVNVVWSDWLDENNPCASLEGEGWRVPNQKEMTILMLLGEYEQTSSEQYGITCTLGYFDTSGNKFSLGSTLSSVSFNLMKANYQNGMMTQTRKSDSNGQVAIAPGDKTYSVRCVRDVD